jgi:hypothetical protein
MKLTSAWVTAGALALAACGSKGDGKPGAATPEAAVRSFFEAAAAGDVARARRFLMSEDGCKVIASAGGRQDECGQIVAEERAWVSDAVGELKGARVTGVTVLPREDGLPAFASLVRVDFVIKGDTEREEVAAIQIDGRYYAAPMLSKKQEDAARPGGMPEPATATEARSAEPVEVAPPAAGTP